MEKINKNLFLTLKQDIIELNKLNDEVKLKIQNPIDSTWMCYKNNEESIITLSESKTTESTTYLTCLEFIVDRLYIILNNFSKYFEENLSRCATTKNVKKPLNFTLGAIANLFWKQLSSFHKEVYKKKSSKETCLSVDVQTDVHALTMCDSCYIAKDCIKTTCYEIENTLFKSSVQDIKKKIKKNIFDLTQVACMKMLTDAVINDVKKTLETNNNLEYEEVKLKNELVYINSKLEEADSKIIEIHAKNERLQNNLNTVQEDSKKLKNQYDSLINKYEKCKSELRERTSTNETLQQQINDLQKNVTNFNEEKAKLNANIKLLNDRTSYITQERDKCNEKYYVVTNKLNEANKKYEEVKLNLNRIELDLSKQKLIKIDKEILKCYDDVKEKEHLFIKEVHEIKSLLKNMMKIRENKWIELLNGLKNPTLIGDTIVKGDPFIDISNQLETNTKNIEILQEQNKKLTKVLTKYKVLHKNFN